MDQRVVSFDLRDKAEIDLSLSEGGFPRLTVSAVSSAWAEDEARLVEQAVEFVHTRDRDPLVSIAFLRSLSDQAGQAAEGLVDLISVDAAGDAGGAANGRGGSSWDNPDSGV